MHHHKSQSRQVRTNFGRRFYTKESDQLERANHQNRSGVSMERIRTKTGRMISRIFYAPGDWLAQRSSARQRRALAAWALIIWLFPGFPLWLYFRDALWFVGF